MASQPSSIALYADVPTAFASLNNDSAGKLAALINKDIGSDGFKQSTASLDALLSTISKQVILSSLGHRETIDDYITFTTFVALQINNEAVHTGTILGEGEKPPYKTAVVLPASGPAILGESLAKNLYDEMWSATSRAYTPLDQDDRNKSQEYYYTTSIHATILARAFALADTFRDSLWRDVEDLLVKGLFSGDEQEPGIFIALTAILLGAGKEIKEYIGDEKKGSGKRWLWYDNVRTVPDERWGWKDVVEALKQQPGPLMAGRLPDFVKDDLELVKKHVGDGQVGESWDSEKLAKDAFNWAAIA
ncbi:hypothetical protein AGABI1DRAFT_111700 [Agaricus bisporus var. burnettii JB137-S8]|uniref:Uncharacterized protein n=1 Tax=Agaricus bisporus var. burnettii (strain JB137-S8 / ATCC MYA-4627 / FGSC 10392) TaxID=597362 RepID=K5X5W7_AGABU|nr:uncharacterized protein AGABI1DRAFT_111700 [Agaricus bisporus var. burnettii JB137-S8]EKM83261.1 hypothetical protein AGABI1DRAFT_111700 [Agaricus bisporus var. burnettii JB137-S8]